MVFQVSPASRSQEYEAESRTQAPQAAGLTRIRIDGADMPDQAVLQAMTNEQIMFFASRAAKSASSDHDFRSKTLVRLRGSDLLTPDYN